MTTDPEQNGEHDAEGYALIGPAFEVYRELGSGFLESVYHEALGRVLAVKKIHFESQVDVSIIFQGRPLESTFRADYLVEGRIVVELKAVKHLLPEHEAQLLNYLKATGIRVGYLINFGAAPKLDWRRRIL